MARNANEIRTRISNNFGPLCVGCAILFLCVSIVVFVNDHFEAKKFGKTFCYIRTSQIGSVGCQRRPFRLCYFATWEVEYGDDRTKNGTIKETSNDRRESFSIASGRKARFQTGSTYPCWYKFDKPNQLQWYKPTTLFGLTLLIIAAICNIVAFIYCLVCYRSSSSSDL